MTLQLTGIISISTVLLSQIFVNSLKISICRNICVNTFFPLNMLHNLIYVESPLKSVQQNQPALFSKALLYFLTCQHWSCFILLIFAGFVDQLKLLQKVSAVCRDNCRPLERSYLLHRKLETKLDSIDKQTRARKNQRSFKSRPVYTAVHSLCLHLQAAMQRQVVILHLNVRLFQLLHHGTFLYCCHRAGITLGSSAVPLGDMWLKKW